MGIQLFVIFIISIACYRGFKQKFCLYECIKAMQNKEKNPLVCMAFTHEGLEISVLQ